MTVKQDANQVTKVALKIDPAMEQGVYANTFTLAHTDNEFLIDFSMAIPGMKILKIVARIIIHPRLAKQILLVLQESIKNYEKTHGEIKLPANRVVHPQSSVMN